MTTNWAASNNRNLFSHVLEPGGRKSRCRRAELPPEAPGEAPSCLLRLLGAPDAPWLLAPSLLSLPHGHMAFSHVCVLFCLRTPVMGLRTHLDNAG